MDEKRGAFENVLGITVIAGLATGFAALLVAGFAFFSADWVGAGVALGAAGLAFGLVAQAVLSR